MIWLLIPVDIFQSIGTEVVLEDEAVPPENTKKLAAALKAQGIAYEAHIYPGVPHGVGTAKGLSAEGWIDQAVEFWMKDGQ